LTARKVSLSSLQLSKSIRKIFFVDDHVCIAVTGLLFDCDILINIARKKCIDYKITYGSNIPIENLCDELSSILHLLTRESKYRPLAVGLIVAGWDEILGS
jgi:20S proteasome alpha/beta subunit